MPDPVQNNATPTPPLEVVNDGPLSRMMPAMITPKGTWFAWGFIAGLLFASAAVYVVKKKM